MSLWGTTTPEASTEASTPQPARFSIGSRSNSPHPGPPWSKLLQASGQGHNPQILDDLDNKLDGLKSKQEQIHTDQWRLLRGAIAEIKAELGDLTIKVLPSLEVELKESLRTEMGEKISKAFEERAVVPRLEALEVIKDVHSKDIVKIKGDLMDVSKEIMACTKEAELKALEQRFESKFESMEKSMTEELEKHDKEIGAAQMKLSELERTITSYAKADQLIKLEDRFADFEKFVGQSLEKSDKEITENRSKLADVQKTLALCATASDLSSVELRIEDVEKSFNESIARTDRELKEQGKTLKDQMSGLMNLKESSEVQFKYQEDLIKANAEKFAKGLDRQEQGLKELQSVIDRRIKDLERSWSDSTTKLEKDIVELRGALGKFEQILSLRSVLTDKINSVELRIDGLEKSFGEPISKHEKDIMEFKGKLTDLQKGLAKCSLTETVESRMKFLEDLITDTANKHWKEIDAAKKRIIDLDKSLTAFVRQDVMEDRLKYLEKYLSESANSKEVRELKAALADVKDSVEKRFRSLEGLISDNTEKDASVEIRVKSMEKVLGDLPLKELKEFKTLLAGLGDSMEKRCKALEALIAENAERQGKEMRTITVKLTEIDRTIATFSSLEDRVNYVEKFMSETTEKIKDTQKEIRDQKSALVALISDLKETMETKLKFLEDLIGDRSRELMKEIDALKKKLRELDSSSVTQDHHATIDERVTYLEKFIGESADSHEANKASHKEHKESMETRLEFIEALIGDNADKHAKELEEAKKKLGDVDKAIAAGAKHDHLASIEERMNYIEKFIGESADRHAKELDAANKKIDNFDKSVAVGVKQEHITTLEERVVYLEKFIGESADQHQKALKDHKNSHADHKESMETRLEYIEALIGDNADKHSKEIEAAKKKLGDYEKAISAGAKHDHVNSLEERMNYIEKFIGESADKHSKDLKDHKGAQSEHKESVEIRLKFLEELIGDNADKHAREIDAAKKKHADMEKVISSSAKHDHLCNMEERMEYIEKFIGESADKHSKDLKDHKNDHKEHKESMETRLKFLEDLIGDTADKHAREIDAAKKKLGDTEKAIAAGAKHDHVNSIEDRINYLEKLVGDNFDKHEKALNLHTKDLKDHKAKLVDIDSTLASCVKEQVFVSLVENVTALEKAFGKHDVAIKQAATERKELKDRFEYLEKFTGDAFEQHEKALKEHMKDVKGFKNLFAEFKESTDIRLKFLDDLIGDKAKEIDSAKNKLVYIEKAVASAAKQDYAQSLEARIEFVEKFASESAEMKKELQTHLKDWKTYKDKYAEQKATLESRFEYLEALIGNAADKNMREINAVTSRLGDLQRQIASIATFEQFGTLEMRIAYLEKFVGDSADKDREKEVNFNLRECMEYFFGVAGTHVTVRLNELAKLEDSYGMNESLPKSVEDLHKQLEHLELMINDLKAQGRKVERVTEVVEEVREMRRPSPRPSIVRRIAQQPQQVQQVVQREVVQQVPSIEYAQPVQVVQVPVPQVQYEQVQVPQVMVSSYDLHRDRMVGILESNAHVEGIRLLFCEHAGHKDAVLQEGDVNNFIAAAFIKHGLAPPDEAQLIGYRKSLFGDTKHLNEAQCLQLMNSVFRSIFINVGGAYTAGTQRIIMEGGSLQTGTYRFSETPRFVSGYPQGAMQRVVSPPPPMVATVGTQNLIGGTQSLIGGTQSLIGGTQSLMATRGGVAVADYGLGGSLQSGSGGSISGTVRRASSPSGVMSPPVP